MEGQYTAEALDQDSLAGTACEAHRLVLRQAILISSMLCYLYACMRPVHA
jgi:hypothetical protein